MMLGRTSNQPGWLERCNVLVLSCQSWCGDDSQDTGFNRLQANDDGSSSCQLDPG